MRVGRAKLRPPACGGGAGSRWRCGEEAQAARCYCGRGGGESSEQPKKDERRASVEEAGVSHPNSVDIGSETSDSDTSVETELVCAWRAKRKFELRDGAAAESAAVSKIQNPTLGRSYLLLIFSTRHSLQEATTRRCPHFITAASYHPITFFNYKSMLHNYS